MDAVGRLDGERGIRRPWKMNRIARRVDEDDRARGRMDGRKTGFRTMLALAACLAAVAAVACGRDAADRDGGKEAAPAPVTVQALEGVQVELHLPDSLAFGQTGEVHATVANRSGTPVSGARLQLFVQLPLQPVPDSAAPAGSTASASTASPSIAHPTAAVPADSGVRLTFAVGALAAGQASEIVERVRLPTAGARDTVPVPIRVRAWVEAADGRAVGGAVEDTLLPRVPSAAACGGAGAQVMRYGVGGVRLGMKANDLRGLCPGVRDTAWREEGTAVKGLAFALAGHPLLAVVQGDSVVRVVVRDQGLATPAGVGVGSTLGDLRARYGRACAAMPATDVVVWFPNAPGIGFTLGAQPPAEWGGRHDDPALLPDTARVTRLRVRSGDDDCPAPAAGPSPQDSP
jgi:hypothetical protein